MTVTNLEIERVSITASKSFEAVVAAVEGAIGRPDLAEFVKAARNATHYAELEDLVNRSISELGLMLFMKFDAGAILRKESGLSKPRAQRFLIGNVLIMKEMAKHVPEAAAYAPVTLLVDERNDGVHLGYDKIESLLRPYGRAKALVVARDLDGKIEKLMRLAAG
ncbi:DUF302 domain-containing protein [Bradyrhizobium sp. ISRA443]|nr:MULTISPECIES: DUF302 domain-containing protein [unclassified Bradyrhizobium]WGR95872.1 DUF302 domain-containing protein [Bradyrhizobium sp. ISRA435]WGS02839.1 DUF302 domain-containing protein [Bradyrhizobium sp. ISRA436]WGS09725.1 DUF302 domain-containing protein [Bradyrhizobium sp. ISRA437]WGS16608.1 DUF302 domain-containing protein [Bradyrhizobium sp. ISRA443]